MKSAHSHNEQRTGRATRSGNAGSCALSPGGDGRSPLAAISGVCREAIKMDCKPLVSMARCWRRVGVGTGTRTGVAGSRGTLGGGSRSRKDSQAGFTLLELALVVFLIGLVAAMTVPQLLPIIAFSELEGSARHIAGYGRGAMAHSALLRDRVVVRVDLKEQEFYAVHWIVEETEEEKKLKEEEPDQLAKLAQLKEQGIRSAADLDKSMLQGGELGSLLSGDDGAFDEELAGYQMSDKFNTFSRQALESRAENIKHDESFLGDVGEIFGEEEVFDLDEKEPIEEELGDPILRRTKLGEGVTITGVDLDGEHISKGVVEIEFTVLGLAQKAVFYVENEDGDAFTVLWDPVSGRTNIFPGTEEDL